MGSGLAVALVALLLGPLVSLLQVLLLGLWVAPEVVLSAPLLPVAVLSASLLWPVQCGLEESSSVSSRVI